MARSRPPARDDEIDGLYDVPLSDFVRRRNEIADRLRAAGKRDAAEAVRAIAKPKVTVWGINKVARRDRAAISAMLAAFDRLKQAQLRRPDEIAAAADALRAAIEAVVHKVMDAIRESGAAVSVDTHRRVATTLRGAAATERDRLRAGELTAELSAPGFELFGGAVPSGNRRRPSAPAPAPAREAATRRAERDVTLRRRPPASAPAPAREADTRRAERDAMLRRRAEQLEAEANARQEEAERIAASALEARQRLRALEAQARAARGAALKARRLSDRARRHVSREPRRGA